MTDPELLGQGRHRERLARWELPAPGWTGHPEYNHSYNAALKNALDHLNQEWAGKPVALLGYGGVAAGARAAEAPLPVLLALRMVPVAATGPIPFASRHVAGEGDERAFTPAPETETGAKAALDGIAEWLGTLGLRGVR